MNTFQTVLWSGVALGALVLSGCGGSSKDSLPGTAIIAGKYIILDTRTDQADEASAKQNAEDTLTRYPDIKGMVGLWGYNPPACLSALKDSGMVGKVKVIGFDEYDATLQGIIDGSIEGTVVQQPFEFGYQSVSRLVALKKGDRSVIPEDGILEIPLKVITKSNVEEFWAHLKELKKMGEDAAANPPQVAEGATKVAFITNGPADFWSYAKAGVAKAEKDLGVVCHYLIPHDGSTAEQQRHLESCLQKGLDGVAISPLDPVGQNAILNQVADAMPLICHDSDAPQSKRLFYLGTNNYKGGREVGKLVKKALPEGGKIMIFVGKLDVLNAQERRQGLIDELMDKPMP